jgi:hypothetical protein
MLPRPPAFLRRWNAPRDLQKRSKLRLTKTSRMLEKAKLRLLTRAAQNCECLFAVVYRAATVRESVP